MCRCSSNVVSPGTMAAMVWAILAAAVATACGENVKAAWRQYVYCSSVNCLVFQGPMCWAGTSCGLVRLDERDDGKTIFTNLNSPLPSNTINTLAIRSDSTLLIGTSEGLARFKQGAWEVFAGPGSKVPPGGVTAILPGDSATMWVGMEYGGVYKVSNGAWTSLASINPGFPLSMVVCPVRSIARDFRGRLWMNWRSFYSSALACLDGSKWSQYDYAVNGPFVAGRDSALWMAASRGNAPGPTYQGIVRMGPDGFHEFPGTSQYLQSMAMDNSGKLWVCSAAGVAGFSGGTVSAIASPNAQPSGMSIITMAVDTSNSLWAGLSTWYPDKFQPEIDKYTGSGWVRHPLASGPCPVTTMTNMLFDQNGNSWMSGGNQTWMFNGSSWTRMAGIDSIVNQSPCGMAIDKSGSAWFASNTVLIRRTLNGQVTVFDSNTLPFVSGGSIMSFAVDSSGRGLAALQANTNPYSYKIIAFDLSSFRVQDSIALSDIVSIRKLVASPDNSVWCDLYGYGVGQWKPRIGFQRFDTNNSVVNSNYVYGLTVGSDSSVWIGGKGLVRCKADVWTKFDTSWSALPGKYCTPLCIDAKGNLWAAVYRTETRFVTTGYDFNFAMAAQSIPAGVARFDGKQWTQYTTINSGLPGNTVNCAAMDRSGSVWMGTNNGVGVFEPGAVNVEFKPKQKPIEESPRALSLSVSQNNLKIRLPLAAKISIMFFDLQGRMQHGFNGGQFSPGDHILSLSDMIRDRIVLIGNVYLALLEADYGNSHDRRTLVFNRCKHS